MLVVDGIALCEPDLSLDRERRPRAAGRLLGDPTTYGSDYFLSKVFGITIHAAMVSSFHLCCNVLKRTRHECYWAGPREREGPKLNLEVTFVLEETT
ncbi:MAG: hypothetical protein H0V83_15185 [Rubrobacter sp.]|nr:hypothetical protein [Rubrobacter sp.]